MPIYEYKCENGHVFDVIQKFTDEALTECQECGAPAVRVLHSPAIHFKGSGFHNTDYGKKKTAAGNGASSEVVERSKSIRLVLGLGIIGLESSHRRLEVKRLQGQGHRRRLKRSALALLLVAAALTVAVGAEAARGGGTAA